MAFWDQVKRQVGRAADEAEKQAAIARLTLEMNGVKGNVRKKVEDLGEVALDLYRKGDLDHADLEKIVVEIAELESRVGELEAQIARVRAGEEVDREKPVAEDASPEQKTE